jgi:CheY-like chemotaxis protein
LKVSFQINDLREQPPGLLAALVVDDDRSLRPIFCGMLEHLGFDTVCAADATQALSLLESKPDDSHIEARIKRAICARIDPLYPR